MCIVGDNQAVATTENTVIGDFEHPEPASHESHCFQVAAQRRLVPLPGSLHTVSRKQQAIQYCDLLEFVLVKKHGKHRASTVLNSPDMRFVIICLYLSKR